MLLPVPDDGFSVCGPAPVTRLPGSASGGRAWVQLRILLGPAPSLHGLRAAAKAALFARFRATTADGLLHRAHRRLRPPAFPTTSRPRRTGTAMESLLGSRSKKASARHQGSTTTRGQHVSCDIDTGCVAFCWTENISAPDLSYAAQYLACALRRRRVPAPPVEPASGARCCWRPACIQPPWRRRRAVGAEPPGRSPPSAERAWLTNCPAAAWRQLRAHRHNRRENQIPIALAAHPAPNSPRLRASTLFGRRLAERTERLGAAGVQKPAQHRPFADRRSSHRERSRPSARRRELRTLEPQLRPRSTTGA